MVSIPFCIAMAGSPAAWAIVILLGLVMISPRLLPVIARLLADHLTREAHRRLGIPIPQARRPPRKPTAEVEILPPEQPTATLRAGSETSIIPKTASAPHFPVWLFVVIVSGA